MRRIITLISISLGIVCLSLNQVTGQSYADIARIMSQQDISGTARIQAIGGAKTALGGDISAISGNPAGLGFYNSSEFSISPGYLFINNSSSYLGTLVDNDNDNFFLANAGAVIHKGAKSQRQGGFKGGAFGFGTSRIASFNNQIIYQGSNTVEDFIDYAVGEANLQGGSAYDNPDLLPELPFLAYQTTLIDRFFESNIPGDTTFFYDRNIYDIFDPAQVAFPSDDFPTLQTETITSSGGHYITNFSYGANFADRFYIGGAIGFNTMRMDQERVFSEAPTDADLIDFTLVDDRLLEGTGINGTLGIIVRPVNVLTLGVSYTSPTFYEMRDESFLFMSSNFNTGSISDEVVFLPLRYNLRTPGRVNGGAALFLDKLGFISADVEWVDYGAAKLSSSNVDFTDVNLEIDNYQAVLNYRIGAELRIKALRLRGGYAFQDDPLDNAGGIDRSRESLTAGIGLRLKKFYTDASYVRSTFNGAIAPYPGAQTALTENVAESAVLTLGFKF